MTYELVLKQMMMKYFNKQKVVSEMHQKNIQKDMAKFPFM